jgi:hypothetical protein
MIISVDVPMRFSRISARAARISEHAFMQLFLSKHVADGFAAASGVWDDCQGHQEQSQFDCQVIRVDKPAGVRFWLRYSNFDPSSDYHGLGQAPYKFEAAWTQDPAGGPPILDWTTIPGNQWVPVSFGQLTPDGENPVFQINNRRLTFLFRQVGGGFYDRSGQLALLEKVIYLNSGPDGGA